MASIWRLVVVATLSVQAFAFRTGKAEERPAPHEESPRVSASHPKLCDDDLVSDACEQINAGAGRIYTDDGLIRTSLSATKSNVRDLWRRLDLPTDRRLDGRYEIRCAHLCEKIRDHFLHQGNCPETSDVACVLDSAGHQRCDLDLGPASVREFSRFQGDLPDFQDCRELTMSRAAASRSEVEYYQRVEADPEIHYDLDELLRRVANLFRIYPTPSHRVLASGDVSGESRIEEGHVDADRRMNRWHFLPSPSILTKHMNNGWLCSDCKDHCDQLSCKACRECLDISLGAIPDNLPSIPWFGTHAEPIPGCESFCEQEHCEGLFQSSCSKCAFCPTGRYSEHVWREMLERRSLEAQAYVNTAIRMFQQRNTKEQMQTWFGYSSYTDEGIRMKVRKTLNSVSTMLGNVDYVYPGPDCKPRVYAYVFPHGNRSKDESGRFLFYLCPLFMGSPRALQIETLTHEGSHHATAYAEDLIYRGRRAYGREICKELADEDDGVAVNNADNICYYIQDITDDMGHKRGFQRT